MKKLHTAWICKPAMLLVLSSLAGLCMTLLESCDNDRKAIRQMCEEMREQYPAATLQDVYKTCYQDYFGSEHLVPDTSTARYYLGKELTERASIDLCTMPRREPTGFRHRFTRVSLACVIDGELTEDQLLAMFIEAARAENAFGDDWVNEWRRIEQIALRVHPAWTDSALQAELRESAENNRAVKHSDAFREAYHPHYRIVRN